MFDVSTGNQKVDAEAQLVLQLGLVIFNLICLRSYITGTVFLQTLANFSEMKNIISEMSSGFLS